MTSFNTTDGTKLDIAIVNIVDSAGQPTVLKSVPVWTSSDPTILNPVAAADGMSADGVALKTGTVTITASADGVSASIAITVAAGGAVSFQLTVTVVPDTPPIPNPPAAP